MRYLYGDSSESPLEINYLAFLPDAIEAVVELVRADEALEATRAKGDVRKASAEAEVKEVEDLGREVAAVVDPLDGDEVPVVRAAAAIGGAAKEIVAREIARVRAALAADLQALDRDAAPLRERGVAAIATLLSTHDLPGARETLTARWTAGGFEVRLRQVSPCGLEATVALAVPGGSLLAHELRIDKLVDGLEIHLSANRGLLKKEMKLVAHKLARHTVAEVVCDPDGVLLRLRAPQDAAGYDVRVAPDGDVTIADHELDDRDGPGLRILASKLEDALRALRMERGRLVSATFDGTPLAEVGTPRVIAERLVTTMAPVVQAIAERSQSPDELVLRRLLGGNRREEIFLSRAELGAKLAALDEDAQAVFAPLGIDAVAAPAPAIEVIAEEPEPEPEAEPEPASEPAVLEADAPPEVVEVEEPPPIAAAPAASGPVRAPSEPAMEMEADLPPARAATPMSMPLPRLPRKTQPPPEPLLPVDSTVAAVEAALRELEDQDAT
jgi:hypothetical protein